ncbi:hypothetical protein DY000_02004914 [Brassica cretica]|uniref:Uncharacterized protein n=1 Tax=Brassica cretica TaxID=69181 RepID=A0ABQ7C2R0_BRACR|nr:hypothetical protein DY000_02004914 [Brassica cretica]
MNEVMKGCLLDWSFAGCNRLSKLDMYLSGAVVDLRRMQFLTCRQEALLLQKPLGSTSFVITASSLSKEPFGKKIGGHEKSLWA